jgi:hypothetical protein
MPLVIEDAFDVEDFRVLKLKPKDILVIRVKDGVELRDGQYVGQKVSAILDELYGKGAIRVIVIGNEICFDVIRKENDERTIDSGNGTPV